MSGDQIFVVVFAADMLVGIALQRWEKMRPISLSFAVVALPMLIGSYLWDGAKRIVDHCHAI